jgi:hypothetical protein
VGCGRTDEQQLDGWAGDALGWSCDLGLFGGIEVGLYVYQDTKMAFMKFGSLKVDCQLGNGLGY